MLDVGKGRRLDKRDCGRNLNTRRAMNRKKTSKLAKYNQKKQFTASTKKIVKSFILLY